MNTTTKPKTEPVAKWGQGHTIGTGVTRIELNHPSRGCLASFDVVRQTNSGSDLETMIDILNEYQAERENQMNKSAAYRLATAPETIRAPEL